MSRKRTRRDLLGIAYLVTAAVLLSSGAAGAAVSPGQALAELNAWRAEAGAPPLVAMRDDWNDGCAAHLRYVAAHGASGHSEDPRKAHYTPAGHDAAASSVLSYGENEGPRTWLHAVYHRASVLQPRLRVSGWASSAHGACLRVIGGVDNSPAARTAQLTLYPWPPNGAVDQPTRMIGDENPSPSEDAGGDRTLGFLLSVGVNGPWSHYTAPETEVHTAQLVDERGVEAAIAISDRGAPNGSALDGGFAIIPYEPLAHGRWYAASATGTVHAEGVAHPFVYTWRFRTASDSRCGRLDRRILALAAHERRLARVQRREYQILRRLFASLRRLGWPTQPARRYRRRLAAYDRRGRRLTVTSRTLTAARAARARLRCG